MHYSNSARNLTKTFWILVLSAFASSSSLSIPVNFSDAAISGQPIVRDFDIFRDQILAKVGKKNSEPTTLRNYDISESVDTDGDGLADHEDPYPLDGTRPFYAGLIAIGPLHESSWINGSAQTGSQFELSIRNDSSFDISLSEFRVLDASYNLIGYTDDPSFLGEDGVLSVDGITGLRFTLNEEAVESAIYLIYYYINPEDLTSEYVGVVFTETQSIPFASYALDTDADGIDNDEDEDDDGDGVNDLLDAFPVDASEQSDSDGDGVGDNSDWAPEDSSESVDTDGDGIGNNADSDDDGDGVSDSEDAFPLKNTETTDSDGDGVGDNDEERAELIALEVLSSRMIAYIGSLAIGLTDGHIYDFAGESDDWTLPIGQSENASLACSTGGLEATVERTDYRTMSGSFVSNDCSDGRLTASGSLDFNYNDAYYYQDSPLQFYPLTFSFSNLRIFDTLGRSFTYSGSLSCDYGYNSVSESYKETLDGSILIREWSWGSISDNSDTYFDYDYLITNDAGGTGTYTVWYTNCDFNNVTVRDGSQNHTIVNAKYIDGDSGTYDPSFIISEYDRSERIALAQSNAVFYRQEIGLTDGSFWASPYTYNSGNTVIKHASKGNLFFDIYSAVPCCNYYAYSGEYFSGNYQDVIQFDYRIPVELNTVTDELGSPNWSYDINLGMDYTNDGVNEDSAGYPWVVTHFGAANSCLDDVIRLSNLIIVDQSESIDSRCIYNDGFVIENKIVSYQDTNLDGHNELFTLDDDNDGVLDAEDNCQAVANLSQVDTDNDSLGNACDKDDDGDGVLDSQDAFPLDNTETSDSDLDGVGDNSDWAPNDSSESVDTDGDGVGDNADAFPTDATETLDTDGDGDGDNTDVDIDGDGLLNDDDPFPMQGQYTADSDSDGMPDAWETRYGLDPNDPSDATSDIDNDGVTALDEFLAGTIPSGSLDIDGNENYDALTDGLLLLRGMFGLDGSALITGTVASDATYTESVDIESRIATLGDLADIDGNGDIDALTDGLLTLRYLFGLQGDTLINGVVASDATRKTAEEIEAHLETLMPSL